MNYLAHAYLSFGNEEILLGNMISDFVKGRQQFAYPENIQKGIRLHRAIDEFTDKHPATFEAKQFFRQSYRLYAGAFIDVVYDHFLANDNEEFTAQSLLGFAYTTYEALTRQEQYMPGIFKKMFFYMHSQNWFYGYRTVVGIHQSFGGLVRRAKYLNDSLPAIEIFDANYELLSEYYRQFWKEVKPFAWNKMNELLGMQ